VKPYCESNYIALYFILNYCIYGPVMVVNGRNM